MKKISLFFITLFVTFATAVPTWANEEETMVTEEAPTLAATPSADYEERSLANIEETMMHIENLLEHRTVKIKTKAWTWEELDKFQNTLWHAMALDPARLESKHIPPHLDPVFLTGELKKELASLRKSRHVAEKYEVTEAFDEYVALCDEIIELRNKSLYRRARVLGKKGIVEGLYTRLAESLGERAQSQVEFSVVWNKADRQELVEELRRVKSEMSGLQTRYSEIRKPASLDDSRLDSMKKLLWVLFPLVFLTGLVGGLTWRSSSNSSHEVDRNV